MSAHRVDAAAPPQRQNGRIMTTIDFLPAADGTMTATITDDLEVQVNGRSTVAIASVTGVVTLDFDDIVAVFTDALTFLSKRGAGTA